MSNPLIEAGKSYCAAKLVPAGFESDCSLEVKSSAFCTAAPYAVLSKTHHTCDLVTRFASLVERLFRNSLEYAE